MSWSEQTERDEPTLQEQQLRRATACAKERDFEGAITGLKAILAVEPGSEIATGMLAAVYAELGMPQRATEYYQRVLALNPDNALARFQLGVLQLNAGRTREALETWEPSLADQSDFAAHYYSGLALLQLEKADEARTLLQKAHQRMPHDHALYPSLKELLHHLDE